MKMEDEIRFVRNNIFRTDEMLAAENKILGEFSPEVSEEVLDYHKSLPGYSVTPLINLANLARRIGVDSIMVKDESKRFQLNAFKVLGSSFALAKYILGDSETIRYQDAVEKGCNISTLVSATDGNHGYSLAHVANLYQLSSKIFMPKGTVPERAERIRRLRADVEVTEYNYDQCVEIAKLFAESNGGLFVQDTALESDTEMEKRIPLSIMQGYTTILQEIINSCPDYSPSHIFLQCGVGSFAGALAAYISNNERLHSKIVCVEPNKADCFFLSAQKKDGFPSSVLGDMDSIMAGLCCGVPSVQAWPILRRSASWFVSCSDSVTRRGMRIFANPLPGDTRIVSGESGAVTMGLLYTILTDKKYENIKTELGLDINSRVLLISTEGDTDPFGFHANIWE
ncbi:uncharacterized protein LOC111709254 [Eurytemora carolleeae]|uniref:uncharacterized protein LOC111709254 n=1 Tax=Eurytemora carolleeae TaxID=1294199 RepID=UPI000C78316A|nr:uncharacterized protein LOC111709254 [Eurytemora carolleeae]|eukprot:XP_023338649.1 uncharacterized protein LOC111709254 [Eurytemora affinis]